MPEESRKSLTRKRLEKSVGNLWHIRHTGTNKAGGMDSDFATVVEGETAATTAEDPQNGEVVEYNGKVIGLRPTGQRGQDAPE